ncbi:MAG: hypothetical protein Q9181_004046 [Wetmoreana brouardii]
MADSHSKTNHSRELPTVVLVQGSFQIPQVYGKLVDGLAALGYPILHPPLPSCSDTDSPEFAQKSLDDDASAIRSEIIRQVEHEGKTVVVVMHSYGGLVGCQAITEDLSYSERRAQGLSGGVIHLFFYSAFLLDKGQSVLEVFGESPNTDVKPDGRSYILHGETTLYNDLPSSEAASWASKLVAQSYRVQSTKLTRTAAWHFVPSTYLICENDQAVPPPFQETFATTAKAHIERCDSGHSAQLSQPQLLVRKIDEVSQKAVAASGHGG